MFFGRTRLLRELSTSADQRVILVGPRRVGKTSLLLRALEHYREQADLSCVDLNLLGIREVDQATRQLSEALDLDQPPASGDEHEGACRSFVDLLRASSRGTGKRVLLAIDEADGIVRTDAVAGYPLLKALRNLQTGPDASFILIGYWDLFQSTMAHSSPLFNFAKIVTLGPLESDAARDLVTEPMTRLGISWEDSDQPDQLVRLAGAYPDIVQVICHQVLEQLKGDQTLTVTAAHLRSATQSHEVRRHLRWSFGKNTLAAGQLLIYRVLESDSFTIEKAASALEQALQRTLALAVLETLLQQLVLYGFVIEQAEGYTWTIPLLRDLLLTSSDRPFRTDRLVEELRRQIDQHGAESLCDLRT